MHADSFNDFVLLILTSIWILKQFFTHYDA